jgi:hypothetical protein
VDLFDDVFGDVCTNVHGDHFYNADAIGLDDDYHGVDAADRADVVV